jgi:hypothetical protein
VAYEVSYRQQLEVTRMEQYAELHTRTKRQQFRAVLQQQLADQQQSYVPPNPMVSTSSSSSSPTQPATSPLYKYNAIAYPINPEHNEEYGQSGTTPGTSTATGRGKQGTPTAKKGLHAPYQYAAAATTVTPSAPPSY